MIDWTLDGNNLWMDVFVIAKFRGVSTPLRHGGINFVISLGATYLSNAVDRIYIGNERTLLDGNVLRDLISFKYNVAEHIWAILLASRERCRVKKLRQVSCQFSCNLVYRCVTNDTKRCNSLFEKINLPRE